MKTSPHALQSRSDRVYRRKAERVVRRAQVLLARGGRLNMSFMGWRGMMAYAKALLCLTTYHHPHGNARLPEAYEAMRRIVRLTGNPVMTVVAYEREVRVTPKTSLAEFMDAARLKRPAPDALRASVEGLALRIDWLNRLERAYETGVFDYEPTAGMHSTRVVEDMVRVAREYRCRVRALHGRILIEVVSTSDPEAVHVAFLAELQRIMPDYDLCA